MLLDYAAISTVALLSRASPFEQPNETTNADEDCNWLHRKDICHMEEIGGRIRSVNVPNTGKPNGNTPVKKYIGIY